MLSKLALLEAILFASPEPIKLEKLHGLLGVSQQDLSQLLLSFNEGLLSEERGISLRHVAGGVQLVTKPEAGEIVRQLSPTRHYKLSKPTLETLAIIAYKQPITRVELEDIRGVKCERSLITLLDKGLILEIGRRGGLGRPILYGTSDSFLVHFNLNSLKDLPILEL